MKRTHATFRSKKNLQIKNLSSTTVYLRIMAPKEKKDLTVRGPVSFRQKKSRDNFKYRHLLIKEPNSTNIRKVEKLVVRGSSKSCRAERIA